MNTLTNFRRTIRLAAWLATGAMCFAPVSSRGQEQPVLATPQAASPAEQQPAVVIKKESKLVLVDSVVTDKKGNYVRDLTQNDFKVFEDNKEQAVSTFSTGVDAATQANGQRRYLILFFDNSTMAPPDQIQARSAATKFIAANAGPDRLMAVVDFGGSLRIVQNFTANAEVLGAAVSGVKSSSVDPNAPAPGVPVTVASTGLSSLGNAEADFGARSMLLAVRSLAKNRRTIPGRKMVVLFSGGFPMTQENQSEVAAVARAVEAQAEAAQGVVKAAPAEVVVPEEAVKAAPPAVAREAAPAVAVTILSLTTATHHTISRGPSCRHSHLRLRPTSRSWLRWRKERADSRFSTPTISSEGSTASDVNKTSFTSLATCPATPRKGVATR